MRVFRRTGAHRPKLRRHGSAAPHRCIIPAGCCKRLRGREQMGVDRFGNSHAPNLSYRRGEILRSTENDFQKLQRAWSLIRKRGPGSTYVLTGLEHSLPLAAEELEFADDEIAPALSFERLKSWRSTTSAALPKPMMSPSSI